MKIIRTKTSFRLIGTEIATTKRIAKWNSYQKEIKEVNRDYHFDEVSLLEINPQKFEFLRVVEKYEISPEEWIDFQKNIHEWIKWLDAQPLPELKCPSHEEQETDNTNQKEIKFVKEFLKDWDGKITDIKIIGAEIIGKTEKRPNLVQIPIPAGRISGNTLKKMFEAYLKVYDKN